MHYTSLFFPWRLWTHHHTTQGEFTFYKSFDEWMKPFPAEDRELYPEMFRIPDGVYEVRMAKPLGIVFEELEAGGGGVYVTDLVEGGNAESQGVVKPGDKLIGVTAIKVSGHWSGLSFCVRRCATCIHIYINTRKMVCVW